MVESRVVATDGSLECARDVDDTDASRFRY